MRVSCFCGRLWNLEPDAIEGWCPKCGHHVTVAPPWVPQVVRNEMKRELDEFIAMVENARLL